MALGIDVGGTFTDVVRWDGERLVTGKLSTELAQDQGVVRAARTVESDAGPQPLLHGTTVATNAVLERRGARTALVVDTGFADLIEIARQDRPSLYDPFADRPRPLVDRALRIELGEDDGAIPHMVEALRSQEPEAVAVALLHAWADPTREQAAAAAIRAAFDVPVSTSAQVVGELREFERMSTTVLNAWLSPGVRGYLDRLATATRDADLASTIEVMRSSGGLMPLADAADLPAAVLLSGPAGGVVAAAALGAGLGHDRLVSFDMGGTSTDVCWIADGRPELAYERDIDGYACRLPSVAVHTVGAGGGSVGWVDAAGALRVGPRSAAAWPGPACYGRGGTQATVTDANLVLGRLDASGSLADDIRLDASAATAALSRLGANLGLEATAAAQGMRRVVEAHMARAVRRVSVERGADPRGAWLVAFGGAGALHATALARELEMAGVIIPPLAGVFSALGLLLSPRRTDLARGTMIDAEGAARLAPMVREVTERLTEDFDAADRAADVACTLDVRYVGQGHETTIDHTAGEDWTGIAERFHRIHARRNGFARPDDPIEVVAVRATATTAPVVTLAELTDPVPEGEPSRGSREVVTADGPRHCEVWWRPALPVGARVDGPAVVEEPQATTFLDIGEHATVGAWGALEVGW